MLAGFDFDGASSARDLVEQGIDVAVTLGGAETLCQFDGLVQYDAIGNFNTMPEFIDAGQQDGLLDRVELLDRSVEMLGQLGHEFITIFADVAEDGIEILCITARKFFAVMKLVANILPSVVGDQPLVQGLHGETPRITALADRRLLFALAVIRLFAHGNSRIRFAISMAVAAASAPLLPALVPARSSACSMLSVVSTPNATGTPDSFAACAQDFAHSPAT